MMFMIPAALLTALVTALLIRSLRQQNKSKASVVVLISVPLLALSLYLLTGSPDTPSASALFERDGPRAMQRSLTAEELTLMQALARDPQNTNIMLSLGAVRLRNGQLNNAEKILLIAQKTDADNSDIKAELGATYYAMALSTMVSEPTDRSKIHKYFQKALVTAPEEAPYIKKLKLDFENFQGAL